ncbi:MAG: TolC family protein [Treponema sp.]|jgi:outer membrane protein TolC|nr:TolC family protein [Treponema sp.]
MKKRLVIFGLFLNAVLSAFGQTLNLEQARVLALANSRSLAEYELSLRSSILNERTQLYSMLPSVSATYSASMDFLRGWDFVNPIDTLTAGASLSITQIIFQGGKSFIQRAINSIATESVRKNALAEYFNVLDTVDNAYYAALEAAATLEAEESSLQTADLALSIAQIRHASGIINQGDYLKALADMEARTNSRNQARRSLALSMAKLKALIGVEGNFEMEQINFSVYEEALQRLSGISDEEADALFNELWDVLVTANPSLARAALSSQRAEKNLSLTWRGNAPTVSATVRLPLLNYSTANGFGTTIASGSVTISGSIPVDFWNLSNSVERSRIDRDIAVLNYANTESSLEQELQSALLNSLAQAGSVLSSRRSLEYTERHFEYVMERYRLSQSSVSDLNEVSTLLITSRNSHIRASYSFLQSLSHLRSLCALDDEELLIKILLGE